MVTSDSRFSEARESHLRLKLILYDYFIFALE